MKRIILTLAIGLLVSFGALAQKNKKDVKVEEKGYQFTIVKENPASAVRFSFREIW